MITLKTLLTRNYELMNQSETADNADHISIMRFFRIYSDFFCSSEGGSRYAASYYKLFVIVGRVRRKGKTMDTIVDLYGDAVTSFIFMGAVIAVFIKILLKVCV